MNHQTPEAALILLSAGTAARRRATLERATALARSLDWEKLAAMLSARRLLPQLGERIVELAAGHAPERFTLAVAQELAQTRRQGALLELVAKRLTRALADVGVDSLMLKGAFLGEAIYGDPGRRAAGDIDLLVAPENLRRAVAVAQQAGYGEPADHIGTDGLPLLHLALAHERGELPPLELHWRVHWYERTFASEMLVRAHHDPLWGLRAQPADELASLLLFYARDGFLDLRLASDLGAWWDACGSQLPSGALAPTFERYPALERALLAALTVAERVVGLPAARLIGAPRRSGARVRLAARLANPGARGDPSQLYADAGFVDWLLAPRGGQLEFVRRQLLPPRKVLDERSRLTNERQVSPLGHSLRVLGRYGMTMARLTAPPSSY
jgi:hypothetical protein